MFGLAAHVIDAPINGDAIEPTVELRFSLEIRKSLIRLQKHLLGEVEGVLGVRYDGEDHVVDAVAMTALEEIEYAGVARLEAGD